MGTRKQYLQQKKCKRNRTKQPGCYGIFWEDVCLYVGESVDIPTRINAHRYFMNHPEKSIEQHYLYIQLYQYDNRVEFRVLEETLDHQQREKYHIDFNQPLYNTYKTNV